MEMTVEKFYSNFLQIHENHQKICDGIDFKNYPYLLKRYYNRSYLFDGEIFIYGITSACKKFIKIGSSVDPYRRFLTLKTDCPLELHISHIFVASPISEKTIHKVLRKFQVRGEWFSFNDHVDYILRGTANHSRLRFLKEGKNNNTSI